MFDQFIKETFLVTLLFTLIPLLASAVVGLVLGVVQAATQIQEQSISYVGKFLSSAFIIALISTWFQSEMVRLFQSIFSAMASLGRM